MAYTKHFRYSSGRDSDQQTPKRNMSGTRQPHQFLGAKMHIENTHTLYLSHPQDSLLFLSDASSQVP